jgi:hypothetical protein
VKQSVNVLYFRKKERKKKREREREKERKKERERKIKPVYFSGALQKFQLVLQRLASLD